MEKDVYYENLCKYLKMFATKYASLFSIFFQELFEVTRQPRVGSFLSLVWVKKLGICYRDV